MADERPPWLTPIAYNEPADNPAPAPGDDGPIVRRGPHDDIFGLDDDDEADDVEAAADLDDADLDD